jgi:hypothetical protein
MSEPVCPSCEVACEGTPLQFKPCGHLLCTPCMAYLVDTGTTTCYVCDAPFEGFVAVQAFVDPVDPSACKRARVSPPAATATVSLQERVHEVSASIVGLSAQADKLAKASFASVATTTRTLHDYVRDLNRVRAKLDEMEAAARSRAQDHFQARDETNGVMLRRLKAGKHHAQLYVDMMSTAIASGDEDRMLAAGTVIAPDSLFAAQLKPDESCFQPVLDYESAVSSLDASTRELMSMVDAEESVVTYDGLQSRTAGFDTSFKQILVDAKTASGAQVEDLSAKDVVLQLVDDGTGEVLTGYDCNVTFQRPGVCSVSYRLPASFTGLKFRLSLYVRDVELMNFTVETKFRIKGEFSQPLQLPGAITPVQGVVHGGMIYFRSVEGMISAHSLVTGALAKTFPLERPDVRQMRITPGGKLWVLCSSDNSLRAYSLDGEFLGQLPVLDFIPGATSVITFDITDVLLIVAVDMPDDIMVFRMTLSGVAADGIASKVLSQMPECRRLNLSADGEGFVALVKNVIARALFVGRMPLIPSVFGVYEVCVPYGPEFFVSQNHGGRQCVTVFCAVTNKPLRDYPLDFVPSMVCYSNTAIYFVTGISPNISVTTMQ